MNAPIPGAGDALFVLLGAIMVLAMHAGFAFLELGTVRKKNQVNALVKILVDFSVSTVVYFLVGYLVAYGTGFLVPASELVQRNGYDLVKFFFLLTFAAAIPAIISGASPNVRVFTLNWWQLQSSSALCTHFLRALPGTSILGFRPGSRPRGAKSSTTLPAQWWFMRWVAGSPCLRCCGWARAQTAIARTVRCRPIPPPAFPFWPWVRGC